MNKFKLFVIILLMFCSCTEENLETADLNFKSKSVIDMKFKISEVKALDIANRFFNRTTRASSVFNIDYVVNNKTATTRSSGKDCDTLAYIFNRGNDEGFIIISSDNRVFPILAYSETGSFEYKEDKSDVIYANFISRIDEYLKSVENSDSIIEVPDNYLAGCVIEEPKIDSSWSQRSPYDKYVIKEHLGCPVGCAAVATAQIMVSLRDSFVYHDYTYDFAGMRAVFAKYPKQTTLSYEEAIDDAAKLLYWIGKDINTKYEKNGSTANCLDALELLKTRFIVRQNTLLEYNDTTVANYILNGDVIFMYGVDYLHDPDGFRHGWTVDGCSFCWKDLDNHRKGVDNLFVHCNWGWGGTGNGYFSGPIFSPKNYQFWDLHYFSVGRNVGLTIYLWEPKFLEGMPS